MLKARQSFKGHVDGNGCRLSLIVFETITENRITIRATQPSDIKQILTIGDE